MKYCRPVWVGMPAGLRDWLCGELEARGLDPPLASLYARCVISILAAWDREKEPNDWDAEFYAGNRGRGPDIPAKGWKGLNNKHKDQRRTKPRLRKNVCSVLTAEVKGVAPQVWLSHMGSRLHFWNDDDGEEMKKSAAVECLLSASDQEWSVEALVDELCTRLKLMQMNAGGTWSTSAPETSSDTLSPQSSKSPEHHSAPEAVDYFSVFPSLTDVVSPGNAPETEPVWHRKGRESKRVPFIRKGPIAREERMAAPGICTLDWSDSDHADENESDGHHTPLCDESCMPLQTSEVLERGDLSETDSGVSEVASSLAILHHSKDTSDFVEVQPNTTQVYPEKLILGVPKCDFKTDSQIEDSEAENLLTSSKTHFCPIKEEVEIVDFEDSESLTKGIPGPEQVQFVPTPSGATLYLPALSSSGRNEEEWQRYMVYKASSTSELDIAVKFRVRGTEKCVQTENPLTSLDQFISNLMNSESPPPFPDEGGPVASASSAAIQMLHVLHTQEQFPFASSSLTKEFEIWKPLDDPFSCWASRAPPNEFEYPCDWPDDFALERKTGNELGLGSIRPFQQSDFWADLELICHSKPGESDSLEETLEKVPGKRQECSPEEEEEEGGLLAEIWEAVACPENGHDDQIGVVVVESPVVEESGLESNSAFPQQDWKEADIDLDGLWNPLEGEVDVCEWLVPEEEYQENSVDYGQGWEGENWNVAGVPVEYLDDDIFEEMFGSVDSNQSLSSSNSTLQVSTSNNTKSRRYFRRRKASGRRGRCGGGTNHAKARPCSFFVEGQCRRVDCKFSHDLASILCRFWSEGSCFKGEDCPFKHTNSARANDESHFGRHDESDGSEGEGTGKFELTSDSDFPTLGAAKDLHEAGSGRQLSQPRPIPNNSIIRTLGTGMCREGSSSGRKRRRGHRPL